MIKKNQHVVPVGTKWGVKGEGNSRYTKVTDTQREAMVVARTDCTEYAIRVSNSWKRWSYSPKGFLWQ